MQDYGLIYANRFKVKLHLNVDMIISIIDVCLNQSKEQFQYNLQAQNQGRRCYKSTLNLLFKKANLEKQNINTQGLKIASQMFETGCRILLSFLDTAASYLISSTFSCYKMKCICS